MATPSCARSVDVVYSVTPVFCVGSKRYRSCVSKSRFSPAPPPMVVCLRAWGQRPGSAGLTARGSYGVSGQRARAAAVRWLLHQWLKRGRGQCEAHGRRRDKTALAFQPEALAPLAPVDVVSRRQSYDAWRSAGRDKIVNSGVLARHRCRFTAVRTARRVRALLRLRACTVPFKRALPLHLPHARRCRRFCQNKKKGHHYARAPHAARRRRALAEHHVHVHAGRRPLRGVFIIILRGASSGTAVGS